MPRWRPPSRIWNVASLRQRGWASASHPDLRSLSARLVEGCPPQGRRVHRGFEAGLARRRLTGFQPSRAHLNTLIAAAGPDITARARWLVRNNGYAANAIESWASNVVSAGIKPSALIADPGLKAQVQSSGSTGLFAEILQELANTASAMSEDDTDHRIALREAAKALHQSLTAKPLGEDRGKNKSEHHEPVHHEADISNMTPEEEVLLLHIME